MKITYVIDRADKSGDLRARSHLLDAMTELDSQYLKRHPEVLGLSTRVKQKPGSGSEWHDIPTILEQGWGGYEDLACWRAAEASLQGAGPPPEFAWRDFPRNGRVVFHVSLFEGGGANQSKAQIMADHEGLHTLLHALTQIDIDYLASHQQTPKLYDLHSQGLFRYQAEPEGEEDWLDIPSAIRQGWGDCEDIACWRVAELNVRYGFPATPTFVWLPMSNGGNLYHIQVQYPNGITEDPCRKVGMR